MKDFKDTEDLDRAAKNLTEVLTDKLGEDTVKDLEELQIAIDKVLENAPDIETGYQVIALATIGSLWKNRSRRRDSTSH
jgi:hypothetical protein